MEIEVGKTYTVKCHSAPQQITWWVHPSSKKRLKVISTTMAPFNVAANAVVKIRDEDHVSRISSLAESENSELILEKTINASVTIEDKWLRSNYDITELQGSGYVKTSRVETRIRSPFRLQEVGVEEEVELSPFYDLVKERLEQQE